jgi:hypothetical protein
MTFAFDTGAAERLPGSVAGWARDGWYDAIAHKAGAEPPDPRFYRVAADFIINSILKYRTASNVRGAFLHNLSLIAEMAGTHGPEFDRIIMEFAERLDALATDVPPGAPSAEAVPAAPAETGQASNHTTLTNTEKENCNGF